MKSMACKQNLPCPALLHQPFAHFRIWPLWEWVKIAVTFLWTAGDWLSSCSLVALQAATLHTAGNYTAAIFTFASCSSSRCAWCWGGQTFICTKRLPLAFFQRALMQPIYLGVMFQPAQAHSLFHFGQQIVKTTVSIPSSSSALSLTFTVQQEGVLIIHME